MPLPCPDLPPFDETAAITLRDAAARGLVTLRAGVRLDRDRLQRWSTRGVRLVAGGERYLFPSVRAGRERLTTPAWCAAWNRLVGLVRAAEVSRQTGVQTAVRRAVGGR